MTRAVPRTHFCRSPLIQLLSDIPAVEVEDARQDIAQRLAPWIGVGDAIALHSALASAPEGSPSGPASRRAATGRTLAVELAALRADLATSIAATVAAMDGEPDLASLQRLCLARQREMELRIGPLRARARHALAGGPPALRRLAALDAVFEQALAERERTALARIPLLLGRRIAAEGGQGRGETLQAVLLAELDLRLQPAKGLIDALCKEANGNQ